MSEKIALVMEKQKAHQQVVNNNELRISELQEMIDEKNTFIAQLREQIAGRRPVEE